MIDVNILVITRSSWRNDNNVGNSMSNFFSNWANCKFYNLSFRDAPSDNEICEKSFHLSDAQLISNLKNRSLKIGTIENVQENRGKYDVKNGLEDKLKKASLKRRANIVYFAQDVLWRLGTWKKSGLVEYIKEISPDLVFMPVFPVSYPHRVLKYICSQVKLPIVLFHADDTYSLKQFNLSLIYWLNRMILRRNVRKSAKLAVLNYCISEIQKQEYEKCFHKKCRLLWKGASFERKPVHPLQGDVIKLVYTGNLGAGRYKQLSAIGEAIGRINADGKKMELDIYSLTPMTQKMKKKLKIPGVIYLKGGVASGRIEEIQNNADILVHVESFDLKNKLTVRQSFSTKIVDYLAKAKCILAVGPFDVASIDYLVQNDAAIVAVTQKEIEERLRAICENPQLIQEFGDKAWECGRRNHQIKEIQNKLYHDFKELADESSTN